MLFCFFFLTFATRRVRLTRPNPTQISHAKGDEERKHKATNSNRLTPATAKLQCNDGMFDDGDGELQPLVQRQQQDDAPATRHPAPAHHACEHDAPRTRRTDGDGDDGYGGNCESMRHGFGFFCFFFLFYFFFYLTPIFYIWFYFFFCLTPIFYFWFCFFFSVQPSSKWLNHHLMLQLQLQQGKIGQTLVGDIVIHLWKGIQTQLFVITAEKSQREE